MGGFGAHRVAARPAFAAPFSVSGQIALCVESHDGLGAAPWDALYNNGVLPSGRVWQSVLEPLHQSAPGLAFTDKNRASIIVSKVKSNAVNIVLTDRSDERENPKASTRDYGLALRFYGNDPDLNPRVAVLGLDGRQWRMSSYPSRAASDLKVSFRVEAAPNEAPLVKLRNAARLPVVRSSIREERLSGSYADFFEAVWLTQPGAIRWSGLAAAPGIYRIGFESRYSEDTPEGRDLDDAYTVLVDGIAQPLEWTKRNTASTGNAFFGLAQTPPLDLAGKTHTVEVRTSKPWAAVRSRFQLLAPQ